MKLRRWVKITILIMVLGAFLVLGYNHAQNAINECVEAGNDLLMCERGLK